MTPASAADGHKGTPRSLRTQLTLFSLGLVLPTALVAIVLIGWNVAAERRSAEQALLANARAMSSAIDQDLARNIAFAEALASSDALAARDWPAVRARIARLKLDEHAWVAISDGAGRRLLNTAVTDGAHAHRTASPQRPANIRRALETGRPLVSDLFEGRTTGLPVVSIDAPALGDRDEVVVSLVLDPNRFLKTMRDRRLADAAFVTLLGRDHRVIMRSRDPARFQGAAASRSMQNALTRADSGLTPSRSLDGMPTVVAYVASDLSGWTTAVVVSRKTFEAPIWRMVLSVLAIFAALLTTSILTARHFASGVALEIDRLESDAKNLSAGEIVGPRWGRIGNIDRVQAALVEASERLFERAERQALLINELNHRVKNTLATVQAMAVQTFRGGQDVERVRAFEQRLVALSGAHDLLTKTVWSPVEIGDILSRCGAQLDGRIRAEGPTVLLAPEAALGLCMILHELQTNSLKYGALSRAGGRVEVRWLHAEDGLDFSWREAGGPPVAPPDRTGFGSRLIDRIARNDLGGVIVRDYRTEGLILTGRFHLVPEGRRWKDAEGL